MTIFDLFGTTRNRSSHAPPSEIDEDDQTVVANENRSSNDREMREICLKWVFPLTGDKRKAMQSHHAMLSMMMKAFPELVVIDNKAQEHVEKKTMKSTEQSRPFEFFTDLRSRRNRSLVCIHRIRTMHSLAELKDAWGVIDELKKQKAYVRTHSFSEKDREISHLGFIPGVHMVNISKEVVKEEIMTMLKQTNAEVPNFEIVQVGVDMGKGSKLAERTRAYEIQCPQKSASSLAKMLQSGIFQEKPVYMPYRIKRTNPVVFKQAIKRQIQTLSEQWVIKLQGFTADMIDCVRDKILESWATGIVPARDAARGEWKILVNRNCHSKTLEWLHEHWMDLMELVPEEVSAASPFNNPKVATKGTNHREIESEEGTIDTYGTILSSLYYGTDDDEEVQSEDNYEHKQSHGPEKLQTRRDNDDDCDE